MFMQYRIAQLCGGGEYCEFGESTAIRNILPTNISYQLSILTLKSKFEVRQIFSHQSLEISYSPTFAKLQTQTANYFYDSGLIQQIK